MCCAWLYIGYTNKSTVTGVTRAINLKDKNTPAKSDTARVGVALIGAGMIAQRHVAALSAIQSRASLIAVVSRHPDRARYLAGHYTGPSPLFTSDIAAVAKNPDIQFVIVATPPSVRIELIETLAREGKHILLEKPVARTVDEALQVVQICERAGVVLGMLFQHQMWATSLEAKRLLASGTLGKPGLIQITAPLWREQSYYDELERGTYARDGGGVLMTQAIHSINLTLSLAGPVSHVQGMTATTSLHQMEAEDFAVAGLRFVSGAVGSLVVSTATYPHGRETISLHCQNGSLLLSADELVISWHDGRCEKYPPAMEITELKTTPKHYWHQAVIEDFIDAIQHGGEPMVSGHAALASHRLIEALEKSSRDAVSIEIAQ